MTRNARNTNHRPTHTPQGRDTKHLQPHDNKSTIKVKQPALSLFLSEIFEKLENTVSSALHTRKQIPKEKHKQKQQ